MSGIKSHPFTSTAFIFSVEATTLAQEEEDRMCEACELKYQSMQDSCAENLDCKHHQGENDHNQKWRRSTKASC